MERAATGNIPKKELESLLLHSVQNGFWDSIAFFMQQGVSLKSIQNLACVALRRDSPDEALSMLEFVADSVGIRFLLDQDAHADDEGSLTGAVYEACRNFEEPARFMDWLHANGFRDHGCEGLTRLCETAGENVVLHALSLYPPPHGELDETDGMHNAVEGMMDSLSRKKHYKALQEYLDSGWEIPHETVESAARYGQIDHLDYLLSCGNGKGTVHKLWLKLYNGKIPNIKNQIEGALVLIQHGLELSELDADSTFHSKVIAAYRRKEKKELKEALRQNSAEAGHPHTSTSLRHRRI